MSQVYLIGGGAGSGKSTVAQSLSDKYGIEYWKADAFVSEHQQEAADRKYPVNNYINSLPEDEQRLELIKLTSKQELARQEELFFILLKELRQRKFDQVILEGNCLLPELVKNRFEYPYKAVYFVPTKDFQRKIYSERDWARSLIDESQDPQLTLKSWIQRDFEFNQEVLKQVKAYEMPCLIINESEPLERATSWAERYLELNILQQK